MSESAVEDARLFLNSLSLDNQSATNSSTDCIDPSDLPTSLIVTNLDTQVFSPSDLRTEFESLFKKFEETATFQYFKSFRRARVNFEKVSNAAKARIQCHELRLGEGIINCYFAQQLGAQSENMEKDKSYLMPPIPSRQFLISPPASPPVGWAPCHEGEPIINYDILAAISQLAPGEAHELHPPSDSQPGIVVHICEDQNRVGLLDLSVEHVLEDRKTEQKGKITQTRRPPNRSHSEGSEDSECNTP
jgi:calcipressin-2